MAAKADSSLSNRRASLSRSLATGLSVDSRMVTKKFPHKLNIEGKAQYVSDLISTLPCLRSSSMTHATKGKIRHFDKILSLAICCIVHCRGSPREKWRQSSHYTDVIMGTIASQITSPTIVYSTVYSDADQRKHQSSASLAFVRGIHRRPVNSPHKWPITRKMFPFNGHHEQKHSTGDLTTTWKRIPHHWPFVNPPVIDECPLQRASNAEL